MIKAEKIQLLKRSFERQGQQKLEGETDAKFVNRIVQEKVSKFKTRFLTENIRLQIELEKPVEEIDVSDLE